MGDVWEYQKGYDGQGWKGMVVEIGIKGGSMYYKGLYKRVDEESEWWDEQYN